MIRKIIAGLLAATMIIGASVPVMADNAKPQVFVNFLANGQNTGKYVDASSNVTAPSVPLVGGHTFCGFDKSLYNVNVNTTYNAVYVSDSLGAEAIAAKKASLPTPAITATTVADPNAGVPAVPAAAPAPAAATTPAAVTPATITPANLATAEQTAMAALTQAQQAVNQVVTADTKAVQNAAQAAAKAASTVEAEAVKDAAQAVAKAASTVEVDAKAVEAAANQVAATTGTGLPSWAVSLHGVDAAGCAEVYKYWKTVKNADDAMIQGNWDALLFHYSGHGTQGW